MNNTEPRHLVALLHSETGQGYAAVGYTTTSVSKLLALHKEYGPHRPIWCVYEYPSTKIVYSTDLHMAVGEYVDFEDTAAA